MSDEVIFEVAAGVARATINRPQRRNALTWQTVGRLREAVSRAGADPSVRVLVLTGAGDRAFCAGVDLAALAGPGAPVAAAPPAGDPTTVPPVPGGDPRFLDRHQARGELARLFVDLWSMGKPTIARVRGLALAGGFALALACDLVLAADDAQFATPEIDLGLWPFMATVPLVRSMPPKKALELMLTGRRVGAAEGERIGFVNRVVPAPELDAAVAGLASALADKPAGAMKLGRDSFYAVWDRAAEEALAYLHPMLTLATLTDEAREGMAAFAEKRPPGWAATDERPPPMRP